MEKSSCRVLSSPCKFVYDVVVVVVVVVVDVVVGGVVVVPLLEFQVFLFPRRSSSISNLSSKRGRARCRI